MKEIKKRRSMKNALFLLATLSLIACSTKEKSHDLQPAEFPAFSAESHRGGRGAMPENTIPAMLYSLSLTDITTLEMDIYVTADKKLVLSHDAYLNPKFVLKPDGTETI